MTGNGPPTLREPAGRALPDRGAAVLRSAYETYRELFDEITRRAPFRFAAGDWSGGQADALERLELYRDVLDAAVRRLFEILGEDARRRERWTEMRAAYAATIEGQADSTLAETFFNSATRRVFGTVGVDPAVEFVTVQTLALPRDLPAGLTTVHEGGVGLPRILRQVLEDATPACGYEDPGRDAALAAAAVERHLLGTFGSAELDAVEVLRPVFYRNKGAYLVARLVRGERVTPLVLALLNPAGKAVVDAALLTADEASIVFSFTRSYFHVELGDAAAVVAFLKSIMPRKPVAELVIAIGLHKHGKTELYRDLLRHIESSDDLFVLAPGEKGLVMVVFTLSQYDVVFKVMRDVFAPPKTSNRRDVMEKYTLVFRHGRAGRLMDTQEFEHLSFPVERFDPRLLDVLLTLAGETVKVEGGRVVVHHVYTERRLIPLNLYLASASEPAAHAAVLDFGQTLRELAATNIFPGDLLLKNFGVTRHGRVVFYDYDEVSFLTDCNFRPLPEGADETSEAGFYVGEADVFPEELLNFVGFPRPLRELFVAAHGELLHPAFWTGMQERIRAGEIFDVYPYPVGRRLFQSTAP